MKQMQRYCPLEVSAVARSLVGATGIKVKAQRQCAIVGCHGDYFAAGNIDLQLGQDHICMWVGGSHRRQKAAGVQTSRPINPLPKVTQD